MATYNTVIKKRNATNNGWDSVLPITTAENVLINAEGDNLATHFADFTQQIPYAVTAGSANTYTTSTTPALPALVTGVAITVKIHAVNTGASTLNWNDKGAKAIRNPDGTTVASGDLASGGVYTLRYDGTNFILQGKGEVKLTGDAADANVLSGKTYYNTDPKIKRTGTMPSNPSQTATLQITGSAKPTKAIPAGYTPGGTITAELAPALAPLIKKSSIIGGITGTGPSYAIGDALSIVLSLGSVPTLTEQGTASYSSNFINRLYFYAPNIETTPRYIIALRHTNYDLYIVNMSGSSANWSVYNPAITNGSGSYQSMQYQCMTKNGYLYYITTRGVSELHRLQFSNGAVIRSGTNIAVAGNNYVIYSEDTFIYTSRYVTNSTNPNTIVIEKWHPDTLARVATITCTIPGTRDTWESGFSACVDSAGYIYIGYNTCQSGYSGRCCSVFWAYWENTLWKFNPSGGNHIATYTLGSKPRNSTPNPTGMANGYGRIGICNGIIYQADRTNTLRSFNSSLQLTGSAGIVQGRADGEEIRNTLDGKIQVGYRVFSGNCNLVSELGVSPGSYYSVYDIIYMNSQLAYGVWQYSSSSAYMYIIRHAYKIIN